LVALLDADVGAAGTVALWGVVAGSVLSVAYSVRLLHALVRSHSPETPSAPAGDASQVVRVGLTLPVIIAGVVSLGFGFAAASVGKWLVAPSSSLDVQAVSKLALWPGINDALLISLAVIFVGAVVGWRAPLARASQRKPLGERVFDSLYDATLGVSKRITALTQSGSLPVYVGVTLLMVAGAPITALLMGDTQPLQNVTGGSLLEAVVTLLAVALAVGVAVVPSRFTGALFLGGVGYAIAVIFALRGAPDLAVTQLLVETLTVVVFLLALRAMVRRESVPSRAVPHTLRITVALAVGIAVPLFVLAARTARTQPSAAQEYFARSVAEAGGRNVVNVILVDFRGFDTMGEIVVLAIAALGVANLVRAAEQHRRTAKSAKVSQ
jgi:multicomponent Na+:H+ antiporter subunit A